MAQIQRPNFQKAYSATGLLQDSQAKLCRTLLGWNATENAASPAGARVLFRDGAGGEILIDVRLLPGESIGEDCDMGNAYDFPSGVFVDIVVGEARGSVRGRVKV